MKRVFLFIATVFFTVSLCAQSMKPVGDEVAFKSKMQASASKINTIQSDFVQNKYMAGLTTAIKSSGKFYYQKEDKMALSYTKPMKSQMVMNGSKMMMAAGGKKNVVDASSNKLMGEMKNVMAACFTGDLKNMSSNYKMEFFEDAGNYMVKITPKDEKAKAYVAHVELYLDKKDMSMSKMVMVQPVKTGKKTGDYTEYVFSNKKFNAPIDASNFKVD